MAEDIIEEEIDEDVDVYDNENSANVTLNSNNQSSAPATGSAGSTAAGSSVSGSGAGGSEKANGGGGGGGGGPSGSGAAGALNASNQNNLSSASLNNEPLSIFLYAPGCSFPRLTRYVDRTIEIRIYSKFLSLRHRELVNRELWGGKDYFYTDDSDIVAILQHSGVHILRQSPPTNGIGVSVLCRVLNKQSSFEVFESVERNGIRSRQWNEDYNKYAIEPLKAHTMQDANMLTSKSVNIKRVLPDGKIQRTREIKVTKMLGNERTTKSISSKLKRKLCPISIVFDYYNSACLNYSLTLIGDNGLDPSTWTSARLKNECIYFQGPTNENYELSINESCINIPIGSSVGGFDRYNFVSFTFESLNGQGSYTDPLGNNLYSVPLPSSCTTLLFGNIRWSLFEWGSAHVKIENKIFPLKTITFKPRSNKKHPLTNKY